MRLPRAPIALLAFALAFVGAVPAARSDDGAKPAPKATPKTDERWAFERGEGDTRTRVDIDVSGMPEALRAGVKKALLAQGYHEVDPSSPPPPSHAAPPPVPPPEEEGGFKMPDLRGLPGFELPTGREGDLTSGAMRVGLRIVARVILAYLDAKKDPAKAAAYEALMREMAEAFVKADEGDARASAGAMGRAVAKMLAGLSDPKQAEVAKEVLGIVREELGAAAGRAAGKAPEAGTDLETEWVLGGARVRADAGDRPRTVVLGLREVPAGSAAAKVGLETGDVIVAVGGRPLTARSVSKVRKTFERGGAVALTVLRRGGKRVVFDVDVPKAPPR